MTDFVTTLHGVFLTSGREFFEARETRGAISDRIRMCLVLIASRHIKEKRVTFGQHT